MSSDAFILPVPPQIPACGLNGTETKGPAAFKSSPPEGSSDSGTSFSATLNQISERQNGGNQKATPTGKLKAGFATSMKRRLLNEPGRTGPRCGVLIDINVDL